MKFLLSTCAVVATLSLALIAALFVRHHLSKNDPFLGVATYSSAIVETIAESDPAFRDRFLSRLNGVK